MIVREIFHAVKCDRCGEINESGDVQFWGDESTVIEEANENEWHIDDLKHYCPNCFTVDEETDEVTIKPLFPEVVKKIQKFIITIARFIPETREKEGLFELTFNEYHPIGNAEISWITSFPNVHFERVIQERYSKVKITIEK